MELWERVGYESEAEYARDKFSDEFGYDDEPDPKCCDCDEWTRCSIKGHESVGWCSRWADFFSEDDDRCGDD